VKKKKSSKKQEESLFFREEKVFNTFCYFVKDFQETVKFSKKKLLKKRLVSFGGDFFRIKRKKVNLFLFTIECPSSKFIFKATKEDVATLIFIMCNFFCMAYYCIILIEYT